jgi:putative GTP pyrophosphokinase
MAKRSQSVSKSKLYEKAIKFFHMREKQLHQIRALLDIRLNQLALAYTTECKLPGESITVKTRVKTIDSFLKKLDKLHKDDFDFPDNCVYDLIGARVTCWFLDDCFGMARYISNSNFISVEPENVYDYIQHPRPSGYRTIHIHGKISYENISTEGENVKSIPQKVTCEIQIRTKLMDTWADLTHEFHYKAKDLGIEDHHLERVLETQAKRFHSEDESFIAIRDMYQRMIAKKYDL